MGATVYVIGICFERAPLGHLSIEIQNIVYCSAAAAPPTAGAAPFQSGDGKRRKYGPPGAPKSAPVPALPGPSAHGGPSTQVSTVRPVTT
jgi:hypothetical protein